MVLIPEESSGLFLNCFGVKPQSSSQDHTPMLIDG